jgi:hypothetical protein
MSSAFGSGPSNGQFWFGGSSFPGFLYKKNVGVGGRRSTKMNPGGNITCNSATYLYNKYTPGASGIGASSMSNRRAKNRLATVCRSGDGSNTKNCFPCQPSLGQYSNYTHNPNGFVPCLPIEKPIASPVFELTGEYTYLPSEPGFNTVIEITGPSIFNLYKQIYTYTLVYVNDIYQFTVEGLRNPGTFEVPAGTDPMSGDVYKFIVKFNV